MGKREGKDEVMEFLPFFNLFFSPSFPYFNHIYKER
jgi:hypothetical protein